MMSTALCQNIPMWVGWNSLITDDPLPQQIIGYMKNICLPPTRLDVVAETMRISQKVAEECQQPYAIVTYDLAVAKLALKIQDEDAPQYDNVFICFGAFHKVRFSWYLWHGILVTDTKCIMQCPCTR